MNRRLIRLLFISTILAIVFSSFGFFNFSEKIKIVKKDHKKEIVKELNIVGLGDSLTKGVGDVGGIGYFGRVCNLLQEKKHITVTSTNYAVSGYHTTDLLKQLSEPKVQSSIKKADIILLSIGGNDLFPKFENPSLEQYLNYKPDVKSYNHNMEVIFNEILKLNPKIQIYWLSLYNPLEQLLNMVEINNALIEWNQLTERIAHSYPNINVIPTYDLFEGRMDEMLYKDYFHPNDIGYEAISNRVYENILIWIDRK